MGKIVSLLISIAVILSACSDAAEDANNNDNGPPRVIQAPAYGDPIQSDQDIRIVFNKSMKTDSLNLAGDISASGFTENWQQTTVLNDTLVITPNANWLTGTQRTITINATDLLDQALNELTLQLHVVDSILYVSNSGNDMDNDGSQDLPYATIRHALTAGPTSGTTAILVAAGRYEQDTSQSPIVFIDMATGYSLYGGYNPDNWNQRDPKQWQSHLIDIATSGGALKRVIYIDRSIDSNTVIDGFRITGASQPASGSNAIIMFGGSPIIQNNIIHGGSGTGNSSGLHITDNATPIIRNNVINGGGFPNSTSRGLYLLNRSNSVVENNSIYGGTGRTVYGIHAFGASATIRNNKINGGHTENFLNPGETAWGVYAQSASVNLLQFVEITNNIISAGQSETTYGLLVRTSDVIVRNNTISSGEASGESVIFRNLNDGAVDIENNILIATTGSPKVCLDAVLSDLLVRSLRNNSITGCDHFIRLPAATVDQGNCPNDITKDCYNTIDDTNNATLVTGDVANTAIGNINVAPVFVSAGGTDNDVTTLINNDWSLADNNPCSISEGGLNGVAEGWNFDMDFNGVVRSIPWSMGAYENDTCTP